MQLAIGNGHSNWFTTDVSIKGTNNKVSFFSIKIMPMQRVSGIA